MDRPTQDSFFIAWSGPAGRRVALALKEFFESIFSPLEFFVSDADIGSGTLWMQEIGSRLNAVHAGIAVVTPDALTSPWLHFESGALAKELLASRDSRTRLYTYLVEIETGELAHSPLSGVQARAATKNDTFALAREIWGNLTTDHRPRLEHVERSAQDRWRDLSSTLDEVAAECADPFRISRLAARVSQLAVNAARQVGGANPYLQTVLRRSMHGEIERLATLGATKTLPIPHTLYPDYLVELMTAHPAAQVKAIAILDDEESFWRQATELRVLEASTQHCTRIFVLRHRDHFRTHLPMVRRHAKKYQVRAVWYDQLVKIYVQAPYDFSIVGELSSGRAILARYTQGDVSNRSISFSMDGSKLSEHHDLFSSIHAIALDVRAYEDKGDDVLIDAVFEEKPRSPLRTAPVEMSAYIEIDEYREHEWRHAYYLEMHEAMLAAFEEARRDLPRPVSVLELGAGTGAFTKKIVERGDLALTAIEIDWRCYGALVEAIKSIAGTTGEASPGGGPRRDELRHMQDFLTARHSFVNRRLDVKVLCHLEDARSFDPGGPDGRFHVIFSSFADHHIVSVDKKRYFDNIRANLEPGGLVIVGDEYLPPHAEADRAQALRTYHQHIIDVTRAHHGEAAEGLVRLEMAALESGLEELGDFKLSCAEYEKYVADAGFRFEKQLIGPADPAEAERVGGIYVYLLRADG